MSNIKAEALKTASLGDQELEDQQFNLTKEIPMDEKLEIVIDLSDFGAEFNVHNKRENNINVTSMSLADIVTYLKTLLEKLNAEYVVVGGVAAGALTEPRGTNDIDVVILIKPEDVSLLLDEVEKSIVIQKRDMVKSKLVKGKPAKIMWNKRQSFDLRLANYSIDYSALKRALKVQFRGNEIRVVSPEDLFIYKLERFRAIDQHDIQQLIKFYPNLDWSYIEKNAEILSKESGISSILRDLKTARSWREC